MSRLPLLVGKRPAPRCAGRIAVVIAALACAAWSAAALRAADEDIVLFDATTTPLTSVASQSGGKFALRDGLLTVETAGQSGYPGVRIQGAWNLSKCNRLTLELANRDRKGELPLTVRLDNPHANPGQSQGVFIDRVKIRGTAPSCYTVSLPPMPPHAREINRRLFGMKRGPLATTGVAADLDATQVVGVAIYINNPKLDWLWGVKRIIAHVGPQPDVPAWLRLPPEQFFPFIDEYGQFKHKDWPGKTHSDADLKRAREAERVDLAAHPGPEGWNQYGGWAKGPRRQATGRFRVEKVAGRWWMVDPEGCLYWSHGPVRVTSSSAVTPLDDREFYFTALPKTESPCALFYTTHDTLLWPYYEARGIQRTYDFSSANAYRKYGRDWGAAYADLAHKRLRSWGMNTIANSSDVRICRQDRTPYCDRFEMKSPDIEGAHLGWWKFKDPFHPDFRPNLRKQMLARKAELDDPWCLGFFVDNEISWGNETALAEWTLLSPATQPAKIEMLKHLREKYGAIAALNAAWKTDYAHWDALLQTQDKAPAGAKDDCSAFTVAVTEAYFKNIRDEFKSIAPHALYLGCRFAGSTKVAVEMSGKYCDVVSYNIYRHTLDEFKLPEGVDKPVLIGEFHFGALDRGMFHPSLIEVADQAARGQAYAAYIRSALRHPNVVGAHWHQFGEQPTTGRFDGENLQNGLLDVCDTPYPETIAGVREVGYRLYELRASQSTTPQGSAKRRPLVGAIRWDAWYGELPATARPPISVPYPGFDPARNRLVSQDPGKETRQALAAAPWRYRWPFFTTLDPDGAAATFDENRPEILEREIDYAVHGGLDYWAFTAYPEASPLSFTLKTFLDCKNRARLHFCLFVPMWPAYGRIADDQAEQAYWAYLLRMIQQPNYLKVGGARPVLFMGFFNDALAKKVLAGPWPRFIKELAQRGLGKPYLVFCEVSAKSAKRFSDLFGGDALSAYAVCSSKAQAAPFTELAAHAEAFWEQCEQTGTPAVPLCMTGWDRRTRVLNPVSWESFHLQKDADQYYYQRGTPAELAAHIGRGVAWYQKHPGKNGAELTLIYAWNELDEGGWLLPALPPPVGEGAARLDALRNVLVAPMTP